MTGSDPAPDDIGVAVVGFGLAGSLFHAPLIAATPGLRLRIVVTAHPERRRLAAAAHPGVAVLATVEELWSHIDGVALVVVATPNHLHAAQAVAALGLGRHVVVDKPMALSSVEASAMIAAAERGRALLAVFHSRRFDNDFLLARQLVQGGALGDVRRFESRYERWRPERSPERWRDARSAAEGGGLLLDLGSHLIDQALLLFGPPESVYAELAARRAGALADDDDFVALRFPAAVRAHLWVSAVAPVVGPRFRIVGSRAALEVRGMDPQEAHLRMGLPPGGAGFGTADPEQRAGLLSDGAASGSGRAVPLPSGRYVDFYAAMAGAIRGAGAVPVTGEEGRDVLRVIEAARRSAEVGAAVPIPGPSDPP